MLVAPTGVRRGLREPTHGISHAETFGGKFRRGVAPPLRPAVYKGVTLESVVSEIAGKHSPTGRVNPLTGKHAIPLAWLAPLAVSLLAGKHLPYRGE